MFLNIDIMGHTVKMYDFWNAVSAAMMFVYLIAQTKQFSEISPQETEHPSEKRRMLVAFGDVLAIIIVAVALFKKLNPEFADWFTQGNANYYGSLTAWFIAITIMPLLCGVSPFGVHDMFAPALPIQLFFAKLACLFAGCCSGFEMSGSWYFNQSTDRYEFPVQLVEALLALALFFFLRWYRRRNKIAGSVFPVYLIVYSVSRFATEFLRADLPNVLGPLDAYQIMSIVYALLGGILLGIVHWVARRTEVPVAA